MTPGKQLHLRIDGMSCGACVARVQEAIASAPGVRAAQVDLTTQSAMVQADVQTTFDSIAQRIAAIGYGAAPITSAAPAWSLDAGQRDHQQRSREHRQALITAVMYGIPVLALDLFGHRLASTAPGSHIWWRALQAVLCGLALYSPAGGPILAGGLRAFLHRTADMNLLISLGLLAALVSSIAAIFIPGAAHYDFHAVAMILLFINVGRYLEARARHSVSESISALLRHVPQKALRLVNGEVEEVALEDVCVGERLRVLPDTQVPVDGTIVEGSATIDESMLTGESIPVAKKTGDGVHGGTMLCSGVVTIEATKLGADSAIGRIVAAVRQAQASPTRMQRTADQVAGVFVPIVVLLSLLTLVGWLVLGPSSDAWRYGFSSAVAVLVIACPCALGLATPTAVYVATARAALKGILVRSAVALEQLGRIDVILFDKTGTLTAAKPQVRRVLDKSRNTAALGENDVLRLAASVEQFSQHPLARAIVTAARDRQLALAVPTDFSNEAGLGATGLVEGRRVLVGNHEFLKQQHISTEIMEQRYKEFSSDGQTIVWVAHDGQVAGLIGIADPPRPGAAEAVHDVHTLGLETMMVTGDHAEVAAYIADTLGIERVQAQTLPAQKAEVVSSLQREGRVVAFVGDGINDAPAITQAHVGIAFAAGTDVAKQVADLILVGDDLRRVPDAIRLGRRALRIIRQNLFWAFCYNIMAIPLAALAFIPHWVAPAAMMFSSLSVVLNSLRLKRC